MTRCMNDQPMNANNLLDPARFDRTDTIVRSRPYCFMVARGQLPDGARAGLARDFPRRNGAGFFPYEEEECGASIRELVDTLVAPAFADAAGRRLGIDQLSRYPTMVTLCGAMNKRHGTIHTDSKSKVVTALLYLNEQWGNTSGGCLRFLKRNDDIDDVIVPEVKPLYGTFAIFKRADNSFHGHLPYEGERRVIQVAWLTSEKEKHRKIQRGLVTRFVKRLAGRLDRKLGARRDCSAAHLD